MEKIDFFVDVHTGGGGVKKPVFFVDIINGRPLKQAVLSPTGRGLPPGNCVGEDGDRWGEGMSD